MDVYIVTEGAAEVELLRRLVGDAVPSDAVEFINAHGRSSAVSLARSLLVARPGYVVLFVDSETTNEQRIEEVRAMLNEYLRVVADDSRFKVLLAVPELEGFLFKDLEGLRRVFPQMSTELSIQGRYEPKAVFQELLDGGRDSHGEKTLLDVVNRLDLDRLREDNAIRELVDFVNTASSA